MADRLIMLARNLRKQSTETEHTLWKLLKAKRMAGLKFKRHQPIGNYIVDFVCFERRIIIELDGGQHSQPDRKQRDEERDKWLEGQGFEILRLWDNEVLRNMREVLEVIVEKCISHPPLPSLSHKGRGDEESP